MSKYVITTKRLGLRNWQDDDLSLAHAMNSDENVMKFFPQVWSMQQTKNFISGMQIHFKRYGFSYFAVDRLDTNTFIGFVGLMHQTYATGFDPFIDIGWRLLPEAWGHGFATEGATACLDFAFSELNLPEIYAIAPELNKKSQRVMQKIGMREYTHFEHPKIEENHPLRNCVAYRIEANQL